MGKEHFQHKLRICRVKGSRKMNFAGQRKQPALRQHCVHQREALLRELRRSSKAQLAQDLENQPFLASSCILKKAARKRGQPQDMGFLYPERRQ